VGAVNANRIAQLALVLSAITLALVLVVAFRPTPAERFDNTPLIRAEIDELRDDIAEVRRLLERGTGENVAGDIVIRLDRLEAQLAGVGAKLDSICGAIESSAFAPSGFACP
jgi:hypothetical protein